LSVSWNLALWTFALSAPALSAAPVYRSLIVILESFKITDRLLAWEDPGSPLLAVLQRKPHSNQIQTFILAVWWTGTRQFVSKHKEILRKLSQTSAFYASCSLQKQDKYKIQKTKR
jgi:hypothetical protein